jgi:hypothetical protein
MLQYFTECEYDSHGPDDIIYSMYEPGKEIEGKKKA